MPIVVVAADAVAWLEMPGRSALASMLALVCAAVAMASGLAGGLVRMIPIVGGCSMSVRQIVPFCSVHRHIGFGLGEEASGGGPRRGQYLAFSKRPRQG